jgi:hypothetical protein
MRNISTGTLQVAACCHVKVPLQNISVPECAFATTFLQTIAAMSEERTIHTPP